MSSLPKNQDPVRIGDEFRELTSYDLADRQTNLFSLCPRGLYETPFDTNLKKLLVFSLLFYAHFSFSTVVTL